MFSMISNKKAIVFDFDGTLVDTMQIFADVASRLIFEHYGLDKDAARQKYFETSGLPFCKQIEIIFPGHSSNEKVASTYEVEKIEATSDIIMDRETQISAVVSETTKELLERHVRATGVKKGYLVEQALRHHLQALQELPAEVVENAAESSKQPVAVDSGKNLFAAMREALRE